MIPDVNKIKKNKYLNIFGFLLHDPGLWYITRYSIATSVSIALFCTFMPIPAHTPIALLLCFLFKANIPTCIVLLWINTPITYVPIFYFAFKVGAWLLNTPVTHFSFEMSYKWVTHELHLIWAPFLLGCLVCAIFFSIVGNLLIRIGWRCSVSHHWKKRQQMKRLRN